MKKILFYTKTLTLLLLMAACAKPQQGTSSKRKGPDTGSSSSSSDEPDPGDPGDPGNPPGPGNPPNPGVTATQLSFSVQPSTVTAGVYFPPYVAVRALDIAGTLDTKFSGVITMILGVNPHTGTLLGTATATAVQGVAIFNDLSVNRAGNGYKLAASSGTLTSVQSGVFRINPGAPTSLKFANQPALTSMGSPITPTLQVEAIDNYGNVNDGFNDDIVASIGTNPSAGVLSGTLTARSTQGRATFSNLRIDKSGTGYTLKARSKIIEGTSAPFTIAAASVGNCPVYYVPVPHDVNVGTTKDFCVAKYEMKMTDASKNILTPGNLYGPNQSYGYDSNYVAASRPDGKPWIGIFQSEARAECAALGPNYSLISNAQWQTVARNLEGVPTNWDLNTIGTRLFVGKGGCYYKVGAAGEAWDVTDCTVYGGEQPAGNDTDPYFMTNRDSSMWWGYGKETKRALTLNNGQVVWDMSSNVWEWTNDSLLTTQLSPALPLADMMSSGFGYKYLGFFPEGSLNRKMFAPAGQYPDSENTNDTSIHEGIGALYIVGNGGPILRGGSTSDDRATIFAAYISDRDSFGFWEHAVTKRSVSWAGFRCVYQQP